ncbi:bifunctional phosphoribosylaminoimidazolecarboxamide formyltransferase/IMP cyclohydrolase, partial [Streptomyces sp. SID10244]|nr:bifunctional phosphoribosylaminoimidazolecarboxamide formyltransferase/IMP cyclohydrolase [Streptomyces sp. SID10244]
VAVVVNPGDYGVVQDAVAAGGFSLDERKALAAKAFRHTADYDVAVASWMSSVVAPSSDSEIFPDWVGATWNRSSLLR